jgi:transcriptional regulator with XRE-family HTH domain
MTAEALATRIRTLRLQTGISQTTAANTAGVHVTSWRNWESGSKRPRLERGDEIAQALNVPVAALFADEVVLAEVRVSEETIEKVRREGRDASKQAAERLALRLEPLIWLEATRKPVDVSAGARPRPRRSRAEVLAGIEQANAMRRAARERRRIE